MGQYQQFQFYLWLNDNSVEFIEYVSYGCWLKEMRSFWIKLVVTKQAQQALYAIVFSLGLAFELKTRVLRTQITYFNPIKD